MPGVKTEFRIASDPTAEQLLKDIWPDLYATIAADYQDRSQGPGQTLPATTIGEQSSIMTPDHPTSHLVPDVLKDKTGAPILKDGAPIPIMRAASNGREAHQWHVHFQIGATGTKLR